MSAPGRRTKIFVPRKVNCKRSIDHVGFQAEKNKSHSASPARDEVSGDQGDGGDGTGGEDYGGGTDLEQDPNETMEDYEAAVDTET